MTNQESRNNWDIQKLLAENYLIIIIFLLGFFLRIYDLGSESIWYDEAISIAVAKLGLIDQIGWSFVQNDNNPPLYYQIMHFWISIFGDSEFSVRFPSALIGSISIFMVYIIGRSNFSKQVGLIAALILATSIFHIKYSQEARAYSLLAFLTLLSFYYYLKLLSSDRRAYILGYIISSALMLYTHYYGFLILAAQNIFFFTNYFKSSSFSILSLKKWVKYQIVIGILYLPGFVLFAKHTVAIQGGFWLPEPTLNLALRAFVIYSGSFYLSLVLVIFSLVSFSTLLGDKDRKAGDNIRLSQTNLLYLLLLWLLVPIILPYLLSLFSTPVLLDRYTIGASIAFYLLAALGIVATRIRPLILIVVCVILVLSYFNLEKYYESVQKYQWRQTMGYIDENASVGDYVAVYPIFELDTAYYYKSRDDMHYYPMNEEFAMADIGNKNLWLVLAKHARTQIELFEKVMGEKYDLLQEKEFKSIKLYKYRKKKAE